MKILVEKAVIERALEALEYVLIIMNDSFKEKPIKEAITALRDALAEPELNLNCKSVQKRLATVWGYVKAEQTEQEPVAKVVINRANQITMQKPNGDYFDISKHVGEYLYAAPIHTKDLTDDEIVDVMNKIYGSMWTEQDRDFARAVIAAYKEKNK